MNKSKFTEAYSKKYGISIKNSHIQIDQFLECVLENMQNDEIVFPGFGKFLMRHKPAKIHRDPRTGDSVNTPAKAYAACKMSKRLAKLD